ncbi:gliding motility-associated C-terminal domain-containing protein [Chitinophaga filiformis]|uniref:T9SS type B sorting domain-containing protein n=1 Tax=Chitinophaga filiformis TaxID=104663 RepID=UPI001F273EEB|nr:gliding motility-associated C-terminal domain-containing protein [Chitinophaga filiformis]MCF6406925.1 gliding motility-associated C-terminal domain-containing protein [Chitinophaga filiformis]
MKLKAGYNRAVTLCTLLFISFITGILVPATLAAQDIGLRNPSLEGIPSQYRAPGQWLVVSSTPDIQPGVTGVYKPASHGKTYSAFRGGPHWLEAIAQKLNTDLLPDKTYRVSFDLYFARGYDSATCYGALAIYGATTLTDTLELLWQSGAFYNTDWQRFTAEFTPHGQYSYIVFGGDVRVACDNAYGIALALDNLSDTLREVPHIAYDIVPSCKGVSTGSIKISVEGNYPPFTCEWEENNMIADERDKLAAGNYIVTIHARNGVTVRDTITVPETEFDGHAAVTLAGCTGENRNKIHLNTTGGTGPYEYYLNGDRQAKLSPEFDNLYAGQYDIIIKDAKGCLDTVYDITVEDPPLFTFLSSSLQQMSCAVTNDAVLTLSATGGVIPYTYSIPGFVSQQDSVIRNLSGGNYTYHITDAQDCDISGDVAVAVASNKCAVFVPNAFSPDGDGVNDVFRVKVFDRISDFRMSVYNRWGQLLYVNTDVNNGWTGDLKGQPLPAGTYLWTITYLDNTHQAIQQQGSVILIK